MGKTCKIDELSNVFRLGYDSGNPRFALNFTKRMFVPTNSFGGTPDQVKCMEKNYVAGWKKGRKQLESMAKEL